jgi:hypothetical protein
VNAPGGTSPNGNPVASQDQRDIEDLAIAILARPEMARAKTIAEMLWRNAVAWPARAQMDRFDNMIEEYLFHYAFRAANGDPAYPRVGRYMVPAHEWFGRRVPGSRWAGDSPDFCYRTIPIGHGRRYRIEGRASCDIENPGPPSVNYSLMGESNCAPVTQQLLDSLDMEIAADGSFTITVDDTAPEGRPNHIQTKPGADFIMVRDALGDWLAQTPNRLAVEALDTPDRAMWDEATLAARAARNLLEGLYYTYYCTQSGAGQPPNEVRAPLSSGAFGGMPTQWGTKGNLDLAADDALVVTSNAAGAGFRNTMLTDNFHISIDYWAHTSSLNHAQMEPDTDGNFTVVVAHSDPGVHNWIDTAGLSRVIYGQRWQAFARGAEHAKPEVRARLVKLDDLEKELAGVARIDAAGRAEQLRARAEGFARRFAEG